AGGALFVLVVLYLFLFQFNQSTLNVEAERITVSTVTKGPFLEFIPQQGQVMPILRYSLNTTEGGRVEKRFLEAGTMVKAGDPIIQLVNTNLLLDIMWRDSDFVQQSNALRQTRLSMDQYRQNLRQTMNQVENELAKQKTTYERYKLLYDNKLVSELEFERIRLDYEYHVRNRNIVAESQKKELEYREEQLDALEEQLSRMETNLNTSKKKLDDLIIRAPIAGQLTLLEAEIGEFKTPGSPIGQIDVLDAYSVRAQVDEHYITRVEAGQKGEFDLAGKTYELKVRRVFPAVQNNRFEVDFVFAGQAPPDLRRGQTLNIRLELGDLTEALLLPRGGFWDKTGGNWVYKLDASGKIAMKHPVRLGRYNPDYYEILEGLAPGDNVITSSYESFGDMDRLVLK
ncbi:MAG: efflux RND transporter periplasmic adaptor subunit, partial [Candidatus Aminicenantes bacterium]|nr:efflux RND transporter periplasmic adaptor subunit [Candidatus Aminicenantes bacterium]